VLAIGFDLAMRWVEDRTAIWRGAGHSAPAASLVII
jgi:hypothetical protein